MTASFTPGPWSPALLSRGVDKEGCYSVYCDGEKPRLVAIVASARSDEAQRADARLIGQAPDLLAVCQAILNDHRLGRLKIPERRLEEIQSAVYWAS